MTVHAGPTIGAGCSASVSYNIGITNIEILRDGGRLLDNNAKCLPGERINLSVRGADPNSTYSWSITGDYFKNYTTSTPSVYEGAGAVPLNQPTIQYRYIKSDSTTGDPKTITCTVLVGGTAVAVQDELKVYKPFSLFKGLLGGWASDFSAVILSAPLGVTGSGMDWKDTTVILSNYGDGKFAFLQVGNVSRTGYDGTNSYSVPSSSASGLDKTFPYETYEKPVGTVVGSSTTTACGDSPSEGFYVRVKDSPTAATRYQAFDRVVVSDTFDTWLMFRSSEAEACWVPLRKMHWQWSADAIRTQPHSPPSSGEDKLGSEATDFPSWISVINIQQPYIKN